MALLTIASQYIPVPRRRSLVAGRARVSAGLLCGRSIIPLNKLRHFRLIPEEPLGHP